MERLPPLAVGLAQALTDRTARVAVIGLGYAGLPLAETFLLRGGFPVLGFDVDAAKIKRLNDRGSYLGHFAADRVCAMHATGRFQATTDADQLRRADALVICVPTPLDANREPDLRAVREATQAIAQGLRPGQLVVLESTTYPGTTRDVVRPILEAGGLRAGQDFFVAFSPEREDPGNRDHATADIPRVVGGLDPVSGQLAVRLFAGAVARVVPVASAEVAEACKILENTYRAVNIALVNELKVLYDRMGIDIWEVIEAARTKPFGFQPFFPGPGWGGHCIPIDPFYLAWIGRQVGVPARFVELAGEINTAMPVYVVDRLIAALTQRGKALAGSRVAVLGVAYKRDVDDCRESPGLELLDLLQTKGAAVSYHDPHVPSLPANRHQLSLTSQPLTEAYLRHQDAVLIVTDHSTYDWQWIVDRSEIVVDTRNATRDVTRHRDRMVRA